MDKKETETYPTPTLIDEQTGCICFILDLMI